MSSLVALPTNLLMSAWQRLRDLLWPRPERPAPAYALAPAPGKRKNALPRRPSGPLAEPEWRPLWPGNRPRQQSTPPDDEN